MVMFPISALLLLVSMGESFAFSTRRIQLQRRLSIPSVVTLARPSTKSTTSMAIMGRPVRFTTSDWIDSLATLPSSRILVRTRGNILFFALWTLLVTTLYHTQKFKFSLPSAIHSVLGSALSLLLVFRTNSSYDRFWEGRKSWGTVVCSSRIIARLAHIHTPVSYHRQIGSLLVCFAIVLKQHLQGDRIEAELAPFADAKELGIIASKRNRPNYLLQRLNEVIHLAVNAAYPNALEAALHEGHFIHAVDTLSAMLGACERIVKQPVPLAYSRHTSRFLTLYILTLPFSLMSTIGWATIPVVTAICWSFVSIQEIGHYIEDPFNKRTQVIPLSQMTSVIRSDVSELLDDVLSSPEMDTLDTALKQQYKANSRTKDENFFAYYLGNVSDGRTGDMSD